MFECRHCNYKTNNSIKDIREHLKNEHNIDRSYISILKLKIIYKMYKCTLWVWRI